MYNNYINRKEAREIRRELKAYKIACGVLAVALVIVAVLFFNYRESKTHQLYSLQNNCEWQYLYNGMEVCK